MFIKPKISQQHAEYIFSAKKTSIPLISKLLSGKRFALPERSEVIYLPFYQFDVLIEKERKRKKEDFSPQQTVTLSVDGLLGHVVLYAADALDFEINPKTPACDFELSSSDAAKLALDQYKGILLDHGLRTRTHPRAEEISEGRKIYYPFWIGYFKKKKGYDFKALDAVSGEIQGVRIRRVFMKALKSLNQQI